jgi:hypothetical protein
VKFVPIWIRIEQISATDAANKLYEPSATASEVPTITGTKAANRVFGLAARIQTDVLVISAMEVLEIC